MKLVQNLLKSKLELKVIREDTAKMACEKFHYSRKVPKGDLCPFGVWENNKFIGAVIFSFPANPHHSTTFKIKKTEILELSRVALTQHKTPVSRIVAIAIKLLKKIRPKVRLLISYADTAQKHVGAIYQAMNWIYIGEADKHIRPMLNGKLVHERHVSHLVKAGKAKRSDYEWVIPEPKHKYLMPIDGALKDNLLTFKKPYPKCASSKEIVASDLRSEGDGENPIDALQLDWCL